MTKNNLVYRAMIYAYNAHKGQKRDGGANYIDHPSQVAEILKLVTTIPEVIAAGWLHDTIEDTDVTYEDLHKEFGAWVADLVNEVTHEGKKDSTGYYFPRLKSREAVLIKFADRLSNLSDMSSWSDKEIDHYLKKSKFWKNKPNE